MLLWRFAMALSCRASVGGTSGYHLTSFFVLQVSYLLLFSLLLCNIVFQSLYPAPKAIHMLLVLNGAILCFFIALMICREMRYWLLVQQRPLRVTFKLVSKVDSISAKERNTMVSYRSRGGHYACLHYSLVLFQNV
jgi:hypothetical protein